DTRRPRRSVWRAWRAYKIGRSRRCGVRHEFLAPLGFGRAVGVKAPMRTFCVETLGCKVNHYESEQVAALLRSAGLVEADACHADLRVVNTCSVTSEAASKSRQATRRLVRLPVLPSMSPCGAAGGGVTAVTQATGRR